MDENDEEHNFNPSLNEYPDSELEKMKGDAIGDTAYSERCVLQILIKIAKFKEEDWDEDFERDLCSLWDMTLERDVVTLLMKHDILLMITNVLCSSKNTRLNEILVGIIGNMSCNVEVRKALSQNRDAISILMALFEQLDSHILIQLIRILNAAAWDLVQDTEVTPKWLEDVIINSSLTPYFSFILKSSTNDELLSCTLDFLNTTCTLEINDKDFSQFFASTEMVSGLLDAWKQLYGNFSSDEGFPNKQLEKTAAHWCGILNSFSGHENGKEILIQFSHQIGNVCYKIVHRPFENLDAILISAVNLLDSLHPSYFSGDVLKQLLLILNWLYQNEETSENSENLEPVLQDTIENYCANISISVPKHVLNHLLAECSENHVLLFWKAVSERQIDDTGERAI